MVSRRARNSSVTLYNYLGTSAGVAAYQRTVIGHVYLDRAYQQRLNQRGLQTMDQALLIVDLSDFSTTDGRTYIPPEQWKQMPTQQRASHFTFQNKDDFFVEGDVRDTLPQDTKATMQAKHRCIAVSQVGVPASARTGSLLLEVTGI